MKAAKTTDDELIEQALAAIRKRFARKPEELAGFVYFLRFREVVKIGWSKDLERRLHIFQDLLPDAVAYEHTLAVKDVFRAERWLHARFRQKRKRREWFLLGDDDLRFVRGLRNEFYRE